MCFLFAGAETDKSEFARLYLAAVRDTRRQVDAAARASAEIQRRKQGSEGKNDKNDKKKGGKQPQGKGASKQGQLQSACWHG